MPRPVDELLAALYESHGPALRRFVQNLTRNAALTEDVVQETMVRAWQSEHPDIAFANIRVGSALGTGVTDSWDRSLLMELSPRWSALGYVHDNGPGGAMTVDQAAAAVLAALTSPVWFRELTAVADPGRPNVFG